MATLTGAIGTGSKSWRLDRNCRSSCSYRGKPKLLTFWAGSEFWRCASLCRADLFFSHWCGFDYFHLHGLLICWMVVGGASAESREAFWPASYDSHLDRLCGYMALYMGLCVYYAVSGRTNSGDGVRLGWQKAGSVMVSYARAARGAR